MPTLHDFLAVRRSAHRADGLVAAPDAPAKCESVHEPDPAFVLPRALNAAAAPTLRRDLLDWTAQRRPGEAWCLLAGQVETVDTAGLQLLLALASNASEHYVRLRLIEPSSALRERCAALGLDGVLLEPDATPIRATRR